MARIVFDTSVWIAYKPTALPNNFLMSAVVLQELTAGATDSTNLKKWETAYRLHEKEGTLLVPTGEDWWLAGKVLSALLRGLKSKAGGLTPKLAATEKQRIIRDVLIARTAKRAGALLVTDNRADFEMIRRFCAVRIVTGKSYFDRLANGKSVE
ncbi:MAG TPA: type II toxin-antitoxin system VapC family toxin [Blastocatellia bacterium]|nr:type II toxin-antitoxin system VapC family toxin [Blastocatellia bacterium]HMV87427.1 type II toxin-antitoxin system VapC family toxin [Blastocatellia bacterium]HMX24596.1 type II toxin-antitoxin system VapC family toxin [Blastocatellia bacterium]HMY73659.1 type II toxin-antitoxin system VapC family toxin [Blastocatellia bacterium]HMZ16662.1 type II toxin-antitoxin system VapC family toxin [Blastocatellia bacterium]